MAHESEFMKKSGTLRTSDADSPADVRRAEFEDATQEVSFTKDFNASLEAVMRDPLETIGTRVMAWIKRKSWGNNCLYCVKSPNGEEAFQVDCAKDLGIDKRRVSATVSYYERRGYLERRGSAKIIYPRLAPLLAQPPDPNEKSAEYRTFYESWKVSHSLDFQEEEAARSTVKRIRQVRLVLFKSWRASRTNETRLKEERLERLTAAAGAAAPGLPEEPAAAVPDPAPQEDAEILQALSHYGNTDLSTARKIKAECRQRYPDATIEEVIQKIHEKGTQRGKRTSPIGFLVVVVPQSFEGYIRPKPAPAVNEKPRSPTCAKCDDYGVPGLRWTSLAEVEEALKHGIQPCDCKEGEAIRKTYNLSP